MIDELQQIFKFTKAAEMVALCFVSKATSGPEGRQRGAILDGKESVLWSRSPLCL